MIAKLKPHGYQYEGGVFALSRQSAGLFLDPGLGKTSIMLCVINGLIRFGDARKVLIVAPLRVVYSVWPAEVAKWSQFRGLRTSIIHGTPKQRAEALNADADIYLINPEGLVWLSKQETNFDVLIIDESTKLKSPRLRTKNGSPTRFSAIKKLLPQFERKYILTGTPSPKSLIDLWSQIYILDGGERLGKNISTFRNRWFYPGRHYSEWYLKPGAKEEIEAAIADIVLVMNCRDLLDMPDLIVNDIFVTLPPSVRTAYNKLESDLFFALETDDDLIDEVASTSASKYGLCRQVANGGLYIGDKDGPREHATTHAAKLDALADLHEELNHKPLLVVYQFRHELERLHRRFGKNVPFIAGGVSADKSNQIIRDWNDGKLPLLFCQPQSMSHGLNLQRGGRNMAWLGLTDDLEVYLQMVARLWRQGQTGGVRVHRILAANTVDVAIRKRIEEKDDAQKSLLDALKNYRKERSR